MLLLILIPNSPSLLQFFFLVSFQFLRQLGRDNLVPLDFKVERTIRKIINNKREVAKLLKIFKDLEMRMSFLEVRKVNLQIPLLGKFT